MGLVLKHQERDRNIPRQRQDLMEAIELDLKNDENVLAVFYGGSIGNQNTDLFSDIDLRIVVKDELFEEYRIHKKERAKKWGSVLFFEDFSWANYSTAHYKGFIKIDSFYFRTIDIKPSVWLQQLKIVHDPTGLLNDVIKKSNTLCYSPTHAEIEHWRTKFFAYLHEAYRRVMRNEIYYALHCIDNMRLSIITAWYMEATIQPNTFGDWAKLEGERSKLNESQLSLLAQWHCSRERNDVLEIMRSIVPEFIKIHKKLCDKYEIEENPELVNEIVNMVI